MAVIDIQNPEFTLTKKQRQILDFIEANPEKAAYASLKDLSGQMQVSEVAILNFCKKIGTENFVGLKRVLQNYIKLRIAEESKTGVSQDEIKEDGCCTAMQALYRDIKNINALLQDLDMDTVDTIASNILAANTIYVVASDVTFFFAAYLANRLRAMGLHATAVNATESETVLSALITITDSDYVIFISFPYYNKRMRNILTLLDERNVGSTTISDSEDCPSVRKGAPNIFCSVESNNMNIWNSHTALVALINVLSAGIAEKMSNRLDDVIQETEDIMKKLNR